MSLLYVYQQTEIIRLAYVGQKSQVAFDELLDKNNILRYNIKKNASLVCIGGRVWGGSDFQMPENYQLVRLAPSEEALGIKGNLFSRGKETVLSRVFGIKRQAEAKTVNP